MTSTAVSAPAPEDKNDKALEPFREMRDALAPYLKEPDRFHLLLPTSYVGHSPLFIPTPTLVIVNPDDEREVYKTPGSTDGSLSFHATALQRMANAAGLDFEPGMAGHKHDRRNDPWVCEQIVGGTYIDSLGQRRPITGGWTTHDLRDGSGRANLLGKRGGHVALEVARQFICEQCSTRATSRAIRKALQLRSSYKRAEFFTTVAGKQTVRPFVAFRFRLDESDPDVKKALIEQSFGATSRVFGLPAPAVDAPARGRDELEDVDGTFTESAGSDSSTSSEGAKQATREPDVVEPEPVAEEKTAEPADRVAEIRARVEKLRLELKGPDNKPWGEQARKKPASDPQVGLVAGSIGAAFAAKVLDDPRKKLLRRAVLAALWGDFTDYAELTSDRMSATIDWAKTSGAEVRELVGLLMERDASLSPVRDALSSQGTLL